MSPDSHPAVVYRTSDPATLAVFIEKMERYNDWRHRCDEYAASVSPDCKGVWVSGLRRLVGLALRDGAPVPEGWHRTRGGHGIVPYRRSKAERAAAEAYRALQVAPCDPTEGIPGMPGFVTVGLHWLHPGIRLSDDRTTLTARWSIDWEAAKSAQDFDGPSKGVGPQWSRVPLSQWYAEQEAEARAEAETEAASG